MAKKRTTAKKRVNRKPPPARRRGNPDGTINTLVILVVIVMVLGGLFLYAQNNKKQAAQWQAFMQTIAAALPSPAPTALPDESQAVETTAGIKDPLKPAAAEAPTPAAIATVRPPSSNQ
jgi:hypothetical protein